MLSKNSIECSLSFKQGIYLKSFPPFSINSSLASTFISSSVSKQSEINPGAITAILLVPFCARSIIILSV